MKVFFSFVCIFFCLSVNASDTFRLFSIGQIHVPSNELITITETEINKPLLELISAHNIKIERSKNITQQLYKTFWCQFKLQNTTQNTTWILEFADNNIYEIEILIKGQSSNQSFKGGNGQGYDFRSFFHKNTVFRVELPTDKEVTIFYKVFSNRPMYMVPWISDYTTFFNNSIKEYIWYGLFIGWSCLFMFISFFLFYYTKDTYALFYSLYVCTVSLFIMSFQGTAYQLIWPYAVVWNENAQPILQGLAIVFQGLYAIYFLHLKVKSYEYWLLISVLCVRIIILILGLSFLRELLFIMYLEPIILALCFYAGIRTYKGADTTFFLLGIATSLVGWIIFNLACYEFISFVFFTYNSMAFGIMAEIIFLAIAINKKISLDRKEKEQTQANYITELDEKRALQEIIILELQEKEELKTLVNKELEHKVALRTTNLADANAKLEQHASYLDKINSKLDYDNWLLKQEVKQEHNARILGTHSQYSAFLETFITEQDCHSLLFNIKWKSGFKCQKCGYKKSTLIQNGQAHKCGKCTHIESSTASTLFHGIKFPIQKAFYILYATITHKPRPTAIKLAEETELRLATCSTFQLKVKKRFDELPTSSWQELIKI